MCAVGDGPSGGGGGVLPGDGHRGVGLPKGVEGMDGGEESDVEDKPRAVAVIVGGEGYIGCAGREVFINFSPYAICIYSVAVERKAVGHFGIAVEPESQACGGADDKNGCVVGIVVA